MMTRHLCRDFEYKLVINVKQNPEAFFSYYKSRIKIKSKLGDLKWQMANPQLIIKQKLTY